MFQLYSLGSILLAGALIASAILVWRRRKPRIDTDVFRLVAQGASDGLVLMEADSRVIWANPAYCKMMGYRLNDLIGRYPLEYALLPEDRLSPEEARAFRFDPKDERFAMLTRRRNMRSDGTIFMNEFSHAVIPTCGKTLYLLSSRDVTLAVKREEALVAARESIDIKARADALTGLANRLEMQRALDALFAVSAPFAVIQMDLTRFKEINDIYGHSAGDALLCHIANTLDAHADQSWTTARTGADEFVILAPNITTLDAALDHAAQLVKATKAQMPWKAGTLSARAVAGVAVRDAKTRSTDELLNASSIALSAAKIRGPLSIAAYDDTLHDAYMREQELHKELTTAFATGQIIFHFQPIVDLRTQHVVKFEMLARWLHPEKGLISPGIFMPAAQHLGLMQNLDEMVMDTASAALTAMTGAGLEKTGLSINISDEGLFGEMPVLMVWQADAGLIDPSRISIEVLETTAITLAEDDVAIATLAQLSKAGFRIFLDDFGMGYAGLSHLAGLDVDGIKIDRGLISVIDSNATSHSVVTALINLCKELGLEVIAEGTETSAQIDAIGAIGATLLQGYALAKPMPLEDAIAWAHDFEISDTAKAG